MSGKLIRKKLEELAESVVFAEISDGKALAEIRGRLEFIGKWAEKQRHAAIVESARASCDRVQAMIDGRVADAGAAIGSLGAAVADLQKSVLEALGSTDGAAPPQRLVDEKLLSGFLDSRADVLARIETLARETGRPGRTGGADELCRLFHTMKGEAAFLELGDVERLCRAAESFLREAPASGAAGVLLKAKEWLAGEFDSRGGRGGAPGPVETILDLMRSAGAAKPTGGEVPAGGGSAARAARPEPTDAAFAQGDAGLLASFIAESKEHLDTATVHLLTLETRPDDMEALDAVFRAFHTIKGITGLLNLEDIKDLSHEVESLLDQARKGALTMSGAPIDVAFESIEMLKAMVDALAETLRTGKTPARSEEVPELIRRIAGVGSVAATSDAVRYEPIAGKLGDILVESGKISRDVVDTALSKQKTTSEKKKLGEILVKEMGISGKDIAQALRSQKKPLALKEQIKVDHERLDGLVDAIGELVIAVSMVSQQARSAGGWSPDLARHFGHLEKITRELQDMGTSLRMVPVRPTFQKMALLVRDLARKAGKPVSFEMSGEDTELDKNIVDKIGDPLTHLIRNAVDHGLESGADERLKAGKNAAGRIALSAFHKGGNIWIEVEDDGRGFSRKAIVAKAVERGIIRDGEELSDREVLDLTLRPGFSTAEKVTEVSGRGVGLDVVSRNVESLRGHVSIRSEEGKGSACSIRLPLTLAIIDGMVVRAGTERYIIPALSIIRSVKPSPADISMVFGRGELLSVQGTLIPVYRLGTLFNIREAATDPANGVIVVVEDAGRLAGLLTDELLGKQQTVIKPLGDNLTGLPGIAGGAIMPDGQVGLILDVGEFVKIAHSAA